MSTISAAEPSQPLRNGSFDSVAVEVYESRQALGIASACAVATAIKECAQHKQAVRMVMASAPSQSEMLASLLADKGVDWSVVSLFHMDEFIGLPSAAPQRFANWLAKNLCEKINAKIFHRLDPDPDPQTAADQYTALLAEAPIDIVCLGIGVNGHIAFNDPPVADFNDAQEVKLVELDATCRQQQLTDQGFATLADVPTHAITLTIPRILDAGKLFCIVPGAHKAPAVTQSLTGPISEVCPASILRNQANCTIYLDRDSASEIPALND